MVNGIVKELIDLLNKEEIKNDIKDIIRPLLELIILELYPYIYYFVLILIFHISLTLYIVYIFSKKMEN
jgi:hypothetical protein